MVRKSTKVAGPSRSTASRAIARRLPPHRYVRDLDSPEGMARPSGSILRLDGGPRRRSTCGVGPDGLINIPAPGAPAKLNKGHRAFKLFDKSNTLIGFYPATVGSEEKPSPSGTLKGGSGFGVLRPLERLVGNMSKPSPDSMRVLVERRITPRAT